MAMKRCCCCLTVAQGVLLSAIYSLVVGIIAITYCSVMIAREQWSTGKNSTDEIPFRYANLHQNFLVHEWFMQSDKWFFVSDVVLYVVWVLSTILLIFATVLCIRLALLPWLCLTSVVTTLYILGVFFTFPPFRQSTYVVQVGDTWDRGVAFLTQIVILALNIYAMVCVGYFYKRNLKSPYTSRKDVSFSLTHSRFAKPRLRAGADTHWVAFRPDASTSFSSAEPQRSKVVDSYVLATKANNFDHLAPIPRHRSASVDLVSEENKLTQINTQGAGSNTPEKVGPAELGRLSRLYEHYHSFRHNGGRERCNERAVDIAPRHETFVRQYDTTLKHSDDAKPPIYYIPGTRYSFTGYSALQRQRLSDIRNSSRRSSKMLRRASAGYHRNSRLDSDRRRATIGPSTSRKGERVTWEGNF